MLASVSDHVDDGEAAHNILHLGGLVIVLSAHKAHSGKSAAPSMRLPDHISPSIANLRACQSPQAKSIGSRRRLPDLMLRPSRRYRPAGLEVTRPARWADGQSKHRQKPCPRRARRSALIWPVAIPSVRSSRPITSRQTPISSAI
jgi:hypothetical protein